MGGPGQRLTFISRSGITASISSPIARPSVGERSHHRCRPRPGPHSPGLSEANFLPSELATSCTTRTSGALLVTARLSVRGVAEEGREDPLKSRGRLQTTASHWLARKSRGRGLAVTAPAPGCSQVPPL